MECNKDFNTKDCKSAADVNCAPAPSHRSKTSFWIQCSACQMKFEYLIRYFHKQLRCRNPNCRKPYVAVEIPPPPIGGNFSSNPKGFSKAQPYPSTSFSGIHLPEELTSSSGTLIKFSSDKAAPAPASYSPHSGVLEPVVRHRKRGHEEATAAVREKWSERIQMSKKAPSGSVGMSSDVNSLETEGIKNRQVGEGGINKTVTKDASQATFANGKALGKGSTSGPRKGQLEDRRRVNYDVINQINSLRKQSLTETRKMLIDKAKKKILKEIHECGEKELADGLNSSQGKVKQKYNEEQKAPANGAKTAAVKHRKPVDGKDGVHIKKTSHAISNVESEAENSVLRQMPVADPDFHDFDNDRTEISFADNQVWATYDDDDDGMPHYYALIHNVISLKPFKVHISWLSSKSNQEIGPLRWVGSGFAQTCGDLLIGKSVIHGSLNSFSHTMRWTKGARGLIQIYPLKGDVWALYRKWSPDWNESTPNEVAHSYDMVEVIEDCSEDRGVTVAPLINVCGFKTVSKAFRYM